MNLDDILTIEDPESEEEYFSSLQRAVNSLVAWRFQGSMGRAMMDALEGGFIMLATEETSDYYGNHIPSRSQVMEGTTGSYGYVVERRGKEWADQMAAL